MYEKGGTPESVKKKGEREGRFSQHKRFSTHFSPSSFRAYVSVRTG